MIKTLPGKLFCGVVLAVLVCSCESEPQKDVDSKLQQGVKGKVLQHHSVGRSVPQGSVEELVKVPRSINVYVFSGKVDPSSEPDKKDAAAIVKSKEDGSFAIPLAPDQYTLAAGLDESDKKLFYNEKWITVTVKDGQWLECNIENENTGK
jgi:hypothetical protein